MNSTIPADLLELKARFETWRATRKYVREPILRSAPLGGEGKRAFLDNVTPGYRKHTALRSHVQSVRRCHPSLHTIFCAIGAGVIRKLSGK